MFVLQDKYIVFIPKRNTADAQIKHAVRYFIFLTQRSADMMSLLYDYASNPFKELILFVKVKYTNKTLLLMFLDAIDCSYFTFRDGSFSKQLYYSLYKPIMNVLEN